MNNTPNLRPTLIYEEFETLKSTKKIADYPDALTIDEVKDILRVSRNTAYGLVKGGALKSVRVGRSIRVPKTELINFLEPIQNLLSSNAIKARTIIWQLV